MLIDWGRCYCRSNEDSNDFLFLEAVKDAFLTQHIQDTTRARGNDTPSTLDVLLTNSAEAIEDLPLNTFKEDLIQEAMKSKTEEVIEKTDGLSSHFQNDIIIDILEIPAQKNIMETDMTESIRKVIDEDIPVISNLVQDGTSDNDDESDMSESEDEFMPDGERIRKTSRGFKQISNCKRFWRASMLTG